MRTHPKSYILHLKSNRGFTLIELLVVMGVLGVLIGGLVFTLNPLEQLQKSRDSQRKNDLAQTQRGLETFYQDYGKYPDNTSNYKIDSDPGATEAEVNWGSSFAPYMTTLPKDPTSSRSYIYRSTGQTYYLYTSLERGVKDIQVCNPDGNPATNDPCTNVPAGVECGTGFVCNYGVSSTNVSP